MDRIGGYERGQGDRWRREALPAWIGRLVFVARLRGDGQPRALSPTGRNGPSESPFSLKWTTARRPEPDARYPAPPGA